MARSLRIEFPGAFYHVTSRGNEQREIFKSQRDREKFLGYLNTATERYGAVIHAYCLMTNHYHLLLQTPTGNLAEIMRHVNGAYTTYYNVKRKRSGHLFQGRYKAILVEADAYATELSRYIHLNPVRAMMVARPEEYLWSSYRSYIAQSPAPSWLRSDFILSYFGPNRADAQARYRAFVEDLLGQEPSAPLKDAVGSTILGRAAFVEHVKEQHLGKQAETRDVPALRQLSGRPRPEAIVVAVSTAYGEGSKLTRQMSLYLCHRYSGAKLKEIGKLFGVRESAITEASRRFALRVEQDEALRAGVGKIKEDLKI